MQKQAQSSQNNYKQQKMTYKKKRIYKHYNGISKSEFPKMRLIKLSA